MIERFRNGDIVRVVSLSGLNVDEDPSLLGAEAVFSAYSQPSGPGGWEVLVTIEDANSPTGLRVWVLDEANIDATGFRMDYPSMRSAIGLRTPEVVGDRIWLRLVTDLTAEDQGLAFERETRTRLGAIAADERIALARSAHWHEPYHFELYAELAADAGAEPIFTALLALAADGWSDDEDDGWRCTRTWDRADASAGVMFIDLPVVWAQVGMEPWSSPAPRRNRE